MTAVKPETGSSLTGYWGSDNSQHVNFTGLDGHVHELYILPGANWVDNDLTELALAQSPAVQSGLSGYWQSDDDSVHVFYNGAGTDNHVYQLRIFPGGPGWIWEDLTSLADGIVPEVSRALSGYWGTDNSQHVNYIGSGNHIHELYRASGASPTDWTDNDLTALAGAVPPHSNTALVSYWGSDSSQHVFFIGTDDHVHELYTAPGTNGRVDNDLTALTGALATPNANTALAGFWDTDSSQHLLFIGTDGHIHELFIVPGIPGWADHDLTNVGHAIAPNIGAALDVYTGSDGSRHINFFGVDGHVHELYNHPGAAGAGWVDNDLTKMANAVDPVVGDRELHGYWGNDSSQHVNFIGTDGDLHELYIAPGTNGWVDNNLTALA
ncbi:MAG TPA: hypothetical protein VGF65_17730 [Mycobacterium sp.]